MNRFKTGFIIMTILTAMASTFLAETLTWKFIAPVLSLVMMGLFYLVIKADVKELRPIFVHDCNHCKFLGNFENRDLYYCGGDFETVIARYGDEGSEYTSGLCFATPDGNKWLYEAKLRAIKEGLLTE